MVWDSGPADAADQQHAAASGRDPHSHPRNDVKARLQKSEFLKFDGKVVDTCGAGPCYANGYTGP